MAITYDAPNNTITVTGYTEGTPCTFLDIWNADQAGGWGVVSKQGTAQFLFDCRLKIGNGSTTTWFIDSEKQVLFPSGSIGAGGRLIEIFNNGYLIFGILEDETTKRTSKGVSMISQNAKNHALIRTGGSGYAYLYSSTLHLSTNNVGSISGYGFTRVWNCILSRSIQLEFLRGTTGQDAFNVIIQKGNVGCTVGSSSAVYDEITITDFLRAFYTAAGYTFTISNTDIAGCTYIIRPYGWSGTGNLINIDSNTWSFDWGGTCTGKVYRQYTFNLKVTEQDGTAINGATVTLKDKDDNEVFSVSTAADGTITEQTVSRGYYDQANGDTLQDYGPFTLEIEKAGFSTYTHEGIVLDEPIDWRIALVPPSAIGVGIVRTMHVEKKLGLPDYLIYGLTAHILRRRRETIAKLKTKLRKS